MIKPNGDIIEGSFINGSFMIGVEKINDKFNGEGIVIKQNGDKYEGRFDLGVFR